MKKLIYIIFFITAVMLTSCNKDTNAPTPTTSEETTLEDMVFPANFNWKTTKDVSLVIRGYANSMLEIKSAEGVVYQKLILKKNEQYTGKLTVPAYETTVHLVYMGQDISFELSNGTISHQFN